jgi:hypothetical protein
VLRHSFHKFIMTNSEVSWKQTFVKFIYQRFHSFVETIVVSMDSERDIEGVRKLMFLCVFYDTQPEQQVDNRIAWVLTPSEKWHESV